MTSPARTPADPIPDRLRRLLPTAVRADLRHRTGRTVPGDLDHRPVAPPPAPGERTGPPDFAVVGSADAATRWWLSLVTDHPDVTPGHPSGGATHFFAPYCTESFGPAQVAAFHAWFPRRPGRVIGFWSPDAMAHPWVPALLAQAAPRARLLAVVRDPVERLLDGLDRTVDLRPPHPGSYLSDAVDRGCYASQLTRLLDQFPRDQVTVLQLERCVADPAGALASTYGFLGVDPTYRARPLDPPCTVPRAGECLDAATLDRLRDLYRDEVRALAALLPDLDLTMWPSTVAHP